ncbi:peptidoglycan bridge formation glycyltransferase FemA/FemB family protein [Candidatus Dojkabacteria bacterium]|uniref:Peptidoglycan bridge formation glycyltransferase FemA/FemB family protein n=1 Tax=Candidatus Dojkabacteria bacterium TaxID=2099670 RepID=A0A955RIY2_9BACT|nr:peptidoglycan bridge formation glycyltransferase FemA/FemB family protein [Candidatus Dojkabacteria bacterium]
MSNLQSKLITNKTEWDEFIKESGIATSFFQSWNWGDFQETLGKEVVRVAFLDENELFAEALCVVIDAKRGKYLYVRNGPVLDWDNIDRVDFVLTELKRIAKEKSLWFVRMSPLVEITTEAAQLLNSYKFPTSPMYDVDALDTWILDITADEEELMQNMRKSTRYEIRKAERDGVVIETSQDSKDLDKFFPIYRDTIERQKWTGYSDEYIRNQFETFVKDDQAKLYLAKYNDVYIAASIFIYFGDSSFYHYSGSLTEYRKVPGPSLIQWYNIREAKARGLKKYNFWGIAPEEKPNHPWQGLSFFKKGFGGEAKRYVATNDIPLTPLHWVTHLYEIYQKKRKGY